MEKQWEDEIDVDDSDLPSLLLRRRSPPPTSSYSFGAAPQSLSSFLRPCSSNPRSSSPPAAPQNPNPRPPPPLPPSRRLIPGPAGNVQAALHRRDKMVVSFDRGARDGCWMDIHREDDNADFELGPWLTAIQFLGSEFNSSVPISSIKDTTERAMQVVGIVKSITPNGLGDLSVTLKDPTGTVNASMHRGVLTEGNLGADMAVGSVIILKQVAVFCPTRTTHYLNVIPGNVVKVISKDCSPPCNQMMPPTVTSCLLPGEQSEISTRGGLGRVKVPSSDHIVSKDIGPPMRTTLPSSETISAVTEEERDVGRCQTATAPASLHDAITMNIERGHNNNSNSYAESLPDDAVVTSAAEAPKHVSRSSEAEDLAVDEVEFTSTRNRQRSGFPASQSVFVNAIEHRMADNRNGDTLVAAQSVRFEQTAPPLHPTATESLKFILEKSVSESTNKIIESVKMDATPPPAKIPRLDLRATEAGKVISKASVTEWTDEQLLELFSDY